VVTAANDRALAVSRWMAGGITRVGAAETAQLERMGVRVIDTSRQGWGIINHDLFLSNAQLRNVIRGALDEPAGAPLNVWAANMTGPLSTRPKNFTVASRSRRAKDRAHHSIGSILPGPVQPDHRIDVVDGDALGLGAQYHRAAEL
jgi:esterase/lipase superfamily enzyme